MYDRFHSELRDVIVGLLRSANDPATTSVQVSRYTAVPGQYFRKSRGTFTLLLMGSRTSGILTNGVAIGILRPTIVCTRGDELLEIILA
jgi:hypothetical protein